MTLNYATSDDDEPVASNAIQLHTLQTAFRFFGMKVVPHPHRNPHRRYYHFQQLTDVHNSAGTLQTRSGEDFSDLRPYPSVEKAPSRDCRIDLVFPASKIARRHRVGSAAYYSSVEDSEASSLCASWPLAIHPGDCLNGPQRRLATHFHHSLA